MTKLASTLPDGHGLEAVRRQLLEEPRHQHVAIALLNCSKEVVDHEKGSREPVASIRTIEVVHPDDRALTHKILTRLGVGPIAIRRSLDRQGIERRDDRAGNSGGAVRTPDTVLRAAGNLYADGLTRTQVADRLGIHIRVVDKGIDLVGVTSADVRAWAKATGRPCPDVGIPARHLVEDYLLATTPSTTDRKAATA